MGIPRSLSDEVMRTKGAFVYINVQILKWSRTCFMNAVLKGDHGPKNIACESVSVTVQSGDSHRAFELSTDERRHLISLSLTNNSIDSHCAFEDPSTNVEVRFHCSDED